MQLKIKFKDDVPYSMATHLINNLFEYCQLFDLVSEVSMSFDDGEEEQLMDTERRRVPRIKKGIIDENTV